MKQESLTPRASTGFAVFDDTGKLLAANSAFTGLGQAESEALTGKSKTHVFKIALKQFKTFDDRPVRATTAFRNAAIERWADPEARPFEVETRAGGWKLLTTHPRPGGGTAFISSDITGLKRAQLAQQENDEVYRCITETHPLPVWMVDEETGEILYETLSASKMLGRDWDPGTPQFITDHYVDPRDRARVRKLLSEQEELANFEVQLKRADGSPFWISANVRRGTFHGRPALISGIIDITERKEREDLFGFLVQNHPMPVWMNDSATGDVLFFSPAAGRLFGWSAEDTNEERHLRNHFVDKAEYLKLSGRLQTETEIEDYDAVLKSRDGREFWVIGNIRRTKYNGRDVVISGIADVSTQKLRQQEIADARSMMADAIESLSEGFALYDEQGRLVMCNSSYKEMNAGIADLLEPGLTWENLMRASAARGIYAEAIGNEERWVTDRLESGVRFLKNYPLEHADGSWYLISIHPTDIGGFVITRSDVTDQKKREQEITEARMLLHDAIESLSEGFALYGPDDRLVMANSRYREMHAMCADKLEPGVNWFDFLRVTAERKQFPVPEDGIEAWLTERAKDRTEYRRHEFQHTSGKWFDVSTNPTSVGGFVVTRLDVTERKTLEEERRKADEVVRQVLDACPVPVQMSTIQDGKILYRNPQHHVLMGEKKSAKDYFQEPKARQRYLDSLMANGELNDYRETLVNADGAPFPAAYSARLLEFKGEQVIVSVITDETERLAAQEEIRRGTELLHDAIESLSEGFALYDEERRLVMCNDRYRAQNRTMSDVLQPGIRWIDVLRTGAERGEYTDAEGRVDDWIRERELSGPTMMKSIDAQHTDGRWYQISNSATRQGGFVVTRSDITERKLMEEAQRQSDAVVRQVLDGCPVPIQMATLESGKILYRSPAHFRLFGDIEEIREYYVRPEDRDRYVQTLRDQNLIDDMEIEFFNASGTKFFAAVSARVIDFQGEAVVVSNSHDLTDRVAAEDATRQANQRLTDAIDSLSEGFALFDNEHNLVMCNQRYAGTNPLLKDKLKPGISYFDLLETGAQRGQYVTAIGRVDDWLDERKKGSLVTEKRYDFETSDGRWYSGSRRPTREGGFVITRVDITDRKIMEEEQREADAVVRQLVAACPAALEMRRIDDGQFLFRSPAAIALLGDRKVLSKTYVRPEDQVRLHEDLEARGEIHDRRIELCRGDGTPFWAGVSAAYADFRGNKVVVSTITDLTERVAVEDESRRASELLRDAIESLQEGFVLYDADHRLVMCNSLFREMNPSNAHLHVPGAKLEELVKAATDAGQYSQEASHWGEVVGDPWRNTHIKEFTFQQSDGRWYSASISPTREGGFVATRTDITDQKKMQEAEREAEERVSQVLEACPAPIQMTEAETGEVLYRSPATVELFGEKESAKEYYVNRAERERYKVELHRAGLVDDFEVQMYRGNGETCWVSVSARLIEYKGRNVIVSHSYDLTDRINMQQELNRQREFLHQSEKLSALGELLAGVAHELNNPLSVVVGQSLMLTETAQDEKTRERAGKIGNAADRCARIVKTFLAMARQQPAQTTNVNVNDILESSLEVAGYSMRTSGVDVTLRLAPDIPFVWGDPDQLNQIFTNLLVNAEQALRGWQGRKKVKIVSRYEPARNEVVVKVQDTGPGILENVRSRIFEPFFTTKEVGEGTGIGLAFCHRIVETHGGTIRAATAEGGGTAFFVRFPASAQTAEHLDDVDQDEPPNQGIRTLVIDDEEDVADLIAEILRTDGHDVTIASSGTEALQRIQKQRFSVILSDLKMANLDGPGLFSKLQEHHPDLASRVGFITGDTMSPKARTFLDASQRPFLEKPIRPDELRAMFSELSETA